MTTLLAVDDSNTIRKVLEITFAGEEDLEVVLASSADEALGLADERRPSLVLVDVTLGSTDGYALCEQLKRASPETPVLLLSSKQNPYDPGRGGACGVDDHVDKPFDTQALIERVRGLLERAPQPVVQQVTYQPPEHVAPVVELEPEPALAEPEYLEPIEEEIQPEPLPSEPPPPAPQPRPPAAPSVEAAAAQAARAASEARAVHGGNGVAALGDRLTALGLTSEQVDAVLTLSREVIEQAVWEVVPTLAETLIKEEIARLTRE